MSSGKLIVREVMDYVNSAAEFIGRMPYCLGTEEYKETFRLRAVLDTALSTAGIKITMDHNLDREIEDPLVLAAFEPYKSKLDEWGFEGKIPLTCE